MAIENFDEVKNYFEANKDNDEVKNFLGGFSNIDVFKEKINTDQAFKSFMDSEKDKHLSKGIETFKSNNLSKLIDDEVNKRFPKIDPKDKEIAELKAQFEQMQKDATRKDLTNKALKMATEKGIPSELVDHFIGEDEDSTLGNIDKLSKILASYGENIKKGLVKDNSYTPPKNTTENKSDNDKLAELFRKGLR